MKKLLTYIFLLCSLSAFCQANLFSAGECVTSAPPAFNPGARGCRTVLDTSTMHYWIWKIGTTWTRQEKAPDPIVGCSAPLYTPTKHQSDLAINGCSPIPLLYKHVGAGVWECLNCAVTSSTDLSFTGSGPTYNLNSSTGSGVTLKQGANTTFTRTGNELEIAAAASTDAQTLSFSNPNLSISGGNSVDLSALTPSTEVVQDITGGMVSGNTETLINVTYDDTNGKLDFAVEPDLSNYNNDAGFLTAEVDGSVTNELQTIANSSDATSHTQTLSNSGGSTQYIEGTGIGFATGGTSLNGTVTITNTLPDQTVVLNNGAGISATGTYPNFTITNTSPSLWTDAGTFLYNTTTTDNAVIGTSTQPSSAYKLQVNGGIYSKGSGATSATKNILSEDSGGNQNFFVTDDGAANFGKTTTTFASDISYFPAQVNAGTINFQNNAVNVFSSIGGFSGDISLLGSGQWANARGVNFIVKSKNSSAFNNLYGGYFSARIGSAGGRALSLVGVNSDAFTDDATGGTTGTITVFNVGNWGVSNSAVTGTGVYGLRVSNIANAGTITNTYGVYVGDVTAGTQTNQAYSYYAEDPNARSYFAGKFIHDATNTAAGTTGNQTINKPSGTVNIAAAGTTVTVTNSLVTASSIVMCVIRTNDATAQIKSVVPAAGSFTVNIVACTGEVSIGFVCYN